MPAHLRFARPALLGAVLLASGCLHNRAGGPAAQLPPPAIAAADLPPVPSAGCRAGSERGSDGVRTITSGGRTRRFILRLPPGGALSKPAPLVLDFHGLVEPAQIEELLSGMTGLAAQRGWVVAYPMGVGRSWNAGGCCGRAAAERVDDVRFIRELLAQLGRELCLDRRRVYATGMSNGGIFSYRLACDASDVIAAIAPVAAVEAAPRCEPRRPVPVLAFNGTCDFLVRYEGSKFWDMASPAESIGRWRKRNGCGQPRVSWQSGEVKCETAAGCKADVDLCTVEGGGHTWPGGIIAPYLGHTTSDVDASRTMVEWFAQQAIP